MAGFSIKSMKKTINTGFLGALLATSSFFGLACGGGGSGGTTGGNNNGGGNTSSSIIELGQQYRPEPVLAAEIAKAETAAAMDVIVLVPEADGEPIPHAYALSYGWFLVTTRNDSGNPTATVEPLSLAAIGAVDQADGLSYGTQTALPFVNATDQNALASTILFETFTQANAAWRRERATQGSYTGQVGRFVLDATSANGAPQALSNFIGGAERETALKALLSALTTMEDKIEHGATDLPISVDLSYARRAGTETEVDPFVTSDTRRLIMAVPMDTGRLEDVPVLISGDTKVIVDIDLNAGTVNVKEQKTISKNNPADRAEYTAQMLPHFRAQALAAATMDAMPGYGINNEQGKWIEPGSPNGVAGYEFAMITLVNVGGVVTGVVTEDNIAPFPIPAEQYGEALISAAKAIQQDTGEAYDSYVNSAQNEANFLGLGDAEWKQVNPTFVPGSMQPVLNSYFRKR